METPTVALMLITVTPDGVCREPMMIPDTPAGDELLLATINAVLMDEPLGSFCMVEGTK